jgi:alginate O-acetyltransferase complex protein AlgI
LMRYALFVSFFPHLIAGPIIRPHQLLPQFSNPALGRFDWQNFAVGTTFLLLGLFKKVILADGIAVYASPVFAAAAQGGTPGAVNAWGAAMAYTFQIYFDFSGYSDMAIGLAHLLGYRLPDNFRLPYLSADIREFWNRWHLSLSRWIRDYLYITMGGSRVSKTRQLFNLIVVMSICGFWHGAQWSFIVWGCLHGLLLAIHRVVPWPKELATGVGRMVCIAATFLVVTLGWVLFRATSVATAGTIYGRLFMPTNGAFYTEPMLATLILTLIVAALMHFGALELRWRRIETRWPAAVVGVAWAIFFFVVHALVPLNASTFIYFQF